MIRRLVLLLWLFAAAASAETASSDENATLDVPALKKTLVALETEQKAHDEPWYVSLDVYLTYRELVAELELLQKRLSEHFGKSDKKLPRVELRQMQQRKTYLEERLKTFREETMKAMEFYLNPVQTDLRYAATLYERFESSHEQLEWMRTLLTKRQNILQKLINAEADPRHKEQWRRTVALLDLTRKMQQSLRHINELRLDAVEQAQRQLQKVEEQLERDNIWQKSYTAYLTYVEVKEALKRLKEEIRTLKYKRKRSEEEDNLLEALQSKQKILSDQIDLLHDHGSSPFAELLKPEEIDAAPEVTNPIEIFNGFSFNKRIQEQLRAYERRKQELEAYTKLLLQKREALRTIARIDPTVAPYEVAHGDFELQVQKFETALSTMHDTAEVYAKRIEEVELQVEKETKKQLYKLINIGAIIVFVFLFFFFIKQIVKRYISDNERFYMANKLITFVNVTLIILVLLFNYIENVSYVVTVLGFASAGIAIAMKDWFMSMLGWMVIVFGGSIHVGDRIRVDKNGMKYVGDVLDISLLRITMLEDITLTSYMHNRRAGRVIFIPNNYIFTDMIANYTHVTLKTVWDGIDITITFDSNHKKAAHIAKEITRKYAKGYTDITRKQLNKLRSRYNLKNTNVDPRIFSFLNDHGVVISMWYLTNAYATLTLRSTISMEVFDAFMKEDDIKIAYPTQSVHMQRRSLPPFEVDPDTLAL